MFTCAYSAAEPAAIRIFERQHGNNLHTVCNIVEHDSRV